MDKNLKKAEIKLYKSLKENGFLVPFTEDDIDAFEKTAKDIIVPNDLLSATSILGRGYSTPHIASKGDEIYSRSLAYAARNGQGEKLPEDLKEQMKRDKERTKKDI